MIRDIWRHQPGRYFCLAFKSDNLWRHEFFERDEIEDAMRLAQRSARTHDVYFAPNGFRVDCRAKEYAVRGRWLYADLDSVRPSSLDLEPTIAVRTSRGRYHAYWFCDDNVDDDLARRLVYHVNADRDSWAANKVLRVPGTLNHKRMRPEPVKLLWDDGPSYRVSELRRDLPRLRTTDTRLTIKSGRTSVSKLIDRYARVKVSGVPLRRCLGVCGAHKRSSIVFGIMCELVKAGASPEEACVVARASWAFKSRVSEYGERKMEEDLTRIMEKLS